MPWPQEKISEYAKTLERLFKQASALTDETVEKLLMSLLDFESELRRTIYGLSEDKLWAMYYWKQIKATVNGLIARYGSRWQRSIYDGMITAAELGDDIIERPLYELGFRIPIISVDPIFLVVAEEYSAELITGISDDIRKAITNNIRSGIAGKISPFETMQQITKDLGTKTIGKETVRGVAYQAERNVRTEMGTIQNMAADARLQKAGKVIPELKKGWMATFHNTRPAHASAHYRYMPGGSKGPIPYNEKFYVWGEYLQYPLDPSASARNKINCGCKIFPVVE